MKLYITNIPKTLPDWATVVSNTSGLIEIEINDEDPAFHSTLSELSTEIQLGIVGVKASDLSKILSIEMTNAEN